MLQWILIILIFNILDTCYCYRRIYVVRLENNIEIPASSTIEVAPGRNLTLRCAFTSNPPISNPGLAWGRRTKEMHFHNEQDLYKLVLNNNPHIMALENESDNSGLKDFIPFRNSDQGTYFCMTIKYKLFKVIHIKATSIYTSSCVGDRIRCLSNGYCISSHYQCDGIEDCPDGSDESQETCNGDPCHGKLECKDGRCIPTSWCCDRRTDISCTVSIRHHCCPFIPSPFDPLYWYNTESNNTTTKEVSKGSGPRYLFIAVCVVSAVLSFILFLFIISKLCAFDKKPLRAHINTNNEAQVTARPNCGHSECAINRELTTNNMWCLYRTEEVSDPLITGNISANDDQPPSYAEVVNIPPSIDKATLEDLINAPPPPYSSTKNISSNQENLRCDTNL